MSWVVAVLLLALVVVLKTLGGSKSFIGFVGEQGVRSKLNLLDKSKYLIINDLMIPNSRGSGTSQIDHVIIFPGGVIAVFHKSTYMEEVMIEDGQ